MRGLGPMMALAIVLAGCAATTPSSTPTVAVPTSSQSTTHSAVLFDVICRVRDLDGGVVAEATCRYQTSNQTRGVLVNATGAALLRFPPATRMSLAADAPGYDAPAAVAFVVDGPRSVRIALAPSTTNGPPLPPGTTSGVSGPANVTLPEGRPWLAPVKIRGSANGDEPQVTVAHDGTIYLSAVGDSLYRSTNGGRTFTDVGPFIPDALPFGGDTSISVAPDNSLWYTRYWGILGTTIGCTSLNRGDSWVCDNAAIPAVSDRMWIVGLSATEGYLQTNEGLYQHVWAHTTTGSLKYTPHATSFDTILGVRNGNMAYDVVNKAVWQLEFVGDTQLLRRVDTATGLMSAKDTGIPAPYGLPWIVAQGGVLWTTGEKGGKVVAARSTDAGATWKMFPVSIESKSATFSYIGAGPDGRVAVFYYGSDKSGPSDANGGEWSVYVAETDNGLDPQPTWLESKLVPGIHTGNICVGLSCEQSGNDPNARFAGDLAGMWVDDHGDAHITYVKGVGADFVTYYMRQNSLGS